MPGQNTLLSPEKVLLTTLMVKLAIGAILATMLVRFPWFTRILLTEKRDWPERLVFAASLGLPLTAGVLSRLLLNYYAADLTLPGAFLAGLLAGPYAGRDRRRHARGPALCRWRVDRPAVCDRLRICRRRLAGNLSQGSDLALFAALFHRPAPHVWRLVRRFEIDWVVLLLAAPIGLEIILQALGTAGPPGVPAPGDPTRRRCGS